MLFFATPCLLFRFGASTPLAQLLDPSLFLVYLACALLMVGFVVAISMNRRMGWNDAAFGALVATCPNTGFMGVPLLVANIGHETFGRDDNELLLIDAQGSHRLPRASKTELAARLVQEIAGRLAEPGRSSASR